MVVICLNLVKDVLLDPIQFYEEMKDQPFPSEPSHHTRRLGEPFNEARRRSFEPEE